MDIFSTNDKKERINNLIEDLNIDPVYTCIKRHISSLYELEDSLFEVMFEEYQILYINMFTLAKQYMKKYPALFSRFKEHLTFNEITTHLNTVRNIALFFDYLLELQKFKTSLSDNDNVYSKLVLDKLNSMKPSIKSFHKDEETFNKLQEYLNLINNVIEYKKNLNTLLDDSKSVRKLCLINNVLNNRNRHMLQLDHYIKFLRRITN